MSNFGVQGMNELVDKLETMDKAGKKIAKIALLAGAKVMLEAQKADAPKKTGASAEALKIGKLMSAASKNQYIHIGIPDGATWDKAKGIYFRHHGFYNERSKKFVASTLWMDKSADKVRAAAIAVMIGIMERELKL